MSGLVAMQSVPYTSIVQMRYSGGRLAVPVSPSQAIYASFEHVIGVPSASGGGASLDRIKLLDTLIDRLSQARKSPVAAPSGAAKAERLDALIEQYRKELVSAVKAAETKPYSQAPRLVEGTAFSLSA